MQTHHTHAQRSRHEIPKRQRINHNNKDYNKVVIKVGQSSCLNKIATQKTLAQGHRGQDTPYRRLVGDKLATTSFVVGAFVVCRRRRRLQIPLVM